MPSINQNQSLVGRIRQKVKTFAHGDSSAAHFLAMVEDKFNVPREYIFYAVFGFLLLYLAFGWGNNFLCDVIVTVYPCYRSVKAIDSKRSSDDTEWLMYWPVYGCVQVFDHLQGVFFYWIPFYCLLKCALLVWMMVPGTSGGSHLLYQRVVRPFFLKHSGQIDPLLNNVQSRLEEMSKGGKAFLNDKQKDISDSMKAAVGKAN